MGQFLSEAPALNVCEEGKRTQRMILNKFYRWIFLVCAVACGVFFLFLQEIVNFFVDKAIKTVMKTLVRIFLSLSATWNVGRCGFASPNSNPFLDSFRSMFLSLQHLQIIKKDCGLKCTSNLWLCRSSNEYASNAAAAKFLEVFKVTVN